MEMPNVRLIIAVFVASAILVVVIINMTIPAAYDIGACTFNQYECDQDIVCTDEVKNKCCDPIRMCEGTTTQPEECYDRYCTADDNMCVPVVNVGGTFDCNCKNVYA